MKENMIHANIPLGIEFRSLDTLCIMHISTAETNKTYAEKKRDEFVWKLKVRKSYLILLLKITLYILSLPVGISVAAILSIATSRLTAFHPMDGFINGIIGGEVILILWLCISAIESHPDYISIKRESK